MAKNDGERNAKEARKARLKEALRRNLMRRKDAAREASAKQKVSGKESA